MDRFDLESRLIQFSISIVDIASIIQTKKVGYNLGNQILRAGTSASLNYGEAQSGESRKDFIHKMKIALKELRETHICLKIINGSKHLNSITPLEPIIDENNQLISIFVRSIETAKKNMKKSKG